MKEHDYAIAEMADTAQEELANALAESQRNSRYAILIVLCLVHHYCAINRTLSEYHELYELQRKRLEAQVGM